MKDFKKVSALFVVGVKDFRFSQELESFLDEFPIGGICLFNSPHDSEDFIWKNPEAAMEAIYEFSSKCRERRLFLCVDQEGGRVARLKTPFIKVPPAQKMGDSFREKKLPHRIYEFYRLVAKQLAITGIGLNLAPVCDLLYQETTSAIGDRCYGWELDEVVRICQIFCEAMTSEGVATTLKHLPGHGPTSFDSHDRIAVSLKTEREMMAHDFKIFEACAEFATCVLPAHMAYADQPERIISLDAAHLDKLRGLLPHHLRWVSDDLVLMKAVSERKPWRACLDAGYDHMLLCGSLDQAVTAIEDSIRYAEDKFKDYKDQLNLEMKLTHSAEAFYLEREMPEYSDWLQEITISTEEALEIWEEIKAEETA